MAARLFASAGGSRPGSTARRSSGSGRRSHSSMQGSLDGMSRASDPNAALLSNDYEAGN